MDILEKNKKLFVGLAISLGLLIAIMSFFAQPNSRMTYALTNDSNRVIDSSQLADWIVMDNRDVVILDMRSAEKYNQAHIKTAVSCPACHESNQQGMDFSNEQMINLQKKLVLYSQSGFEDISVPKIIRDNPNIFLLKGGYDAWEKEFLSEIAFSPEDTEQQRLEKQKKLAIKNYLTGKTISAPKVDFQPVRRIMTHKPAANEGC